MQTNGLVEQFNQTLTDILAAKVDHSGQEWDAHSQFIMFAY